MNSPNYTVSSRVLNLSPSSMELSQLSQFSVTVCVPFCCLQYKFDTNLHCPAYIANSIFIHIGVLFPTGTPPKNTLWGEGYTCFTSL